MMAEPELLVQLQNVQARVGSGTSEHVYLQLLCPVTVIDVHQAWGTCGVRIKDLCDP